MNLHQAALSSPVRETAERAPVGYRLVDDAQHRIGLRDLVFVGGGRGWREARRAGELGALRGDSAALGVAVLAS